MIIKPDKAADRSAGGIWIPETAKKEEQLHTGVVVAMGPGMPMKNGERWPMGFEPGQRVFYYPAGCVKVKLYDEKLDDEVEHHVVRDEQIPAVIDG